MFPANVTLYWRDKTITRQDEEGKDVEEAMPPVSQDVQAFGVEGGALILFQDEQITYLIPLDVLDAVTIQKGAEGEVNESESFDKATATDAGEGTVLNADFGGGGSDS